MKINWQKGKSLRHGKGYGCLRSQTNNRRFFDAVDGLSSCWSVKETCGICSGRVWVVCGRDEEGKDRWRKLKKWPNKDLVTDEERLAKNREWGIRIKHKR